MSKRIKKQFPEVSAQLLDAIALKQTNVIAIAATVLRCLPWVHKRLKDHQWLTWQITALNQARIIRIAID